MADVYNGYIHTHCTVNHPKDKGTKANGFCADAWQGTFFIVLHTGMHVWINGCYSHEGHPEVRRVGDSRSNGYDDHGNCILAVPAEWCKFYTDKEAEDIEALIDADNRLLGYAV